ncbi:hypothetical protein ONA92_26190 [Mycobacteroides salmoniphilum]|uniref:hypothetical protein n=1 Tax=Mycobacteroides salmoniphilum TaxID=404941 RepID=UPI0035639E0F
MALAHAGRSEEAGATGGATPALEVGRLTEERFQELLIKHAYRPTRDPGLWSQFTSAQFIAQTRSVLAMLYTRNQCTMERRAAEISATQAACVRQGHRGRQRFIEANAKYKSWLVGAANFGRTISGALEEVNEVYDRHVNVTGAGEQELRAQLAAALAAIKNHQKQSNAADYEPASHDLQLWRVLDICDDADLAALSEVGDAGDG